MKLSPELLGTINNSGQQPKFMQIADRIRELIDSGKLALGDRLPSVNEIIAHFSVARGTAVKAYQVLKDQGIIESTPNQACFVSNVLMHDNLKKILFLVDSLTSYKEQLYSGLIDTLESGYYVDIMTHGDNFDILKVIYEKYKAMRNCAAILVIPTASQSREFEYFKFINQGNLLFLDRSVSGLKHPAVYQDFKHGFYDALCAESTTLAKYRRVIFLTKYFTNPIIEDMKEGIFRFAEKSAIPCVHTFTPFTDRDIKGTISPEKGDLFLILNDQLLASTLEACAAKGLAVGKDVGIIIINDGPLYEHLPVPISVLTADFYAMGVKAAHYVMSGVTPASTVKTSLIVRASILD